ncbi:MAG: HIT domain-containing protein [Candidatus Binatia bacterium]
MSYIEGEKPDGCIFCSSTEDTSLRSSLILATSQHARVMLNKYPYNNGHLLVAPQRHTAQLNELPDDEFQDLMTLFRRAIDVVNTAFHPQGLNVGMNLGVCAGAGVADHLHWHIVPRWAGDTNFMPVTGSVRVMPQHLLDCYDRLRPYFAPQKESVP